VDALKKTLHRQWATKSPCGRAVDSLLGRIAEFAPLDPEEAEASAASPGSGTSTYQRTEAQQKSAHPRKSCEAICRRLIAVKSFECAGPAPQEAN